MRSSRLLGFLLGAFALGASASVARADATAPEPGLRLAPVLTLQPAGRVQLTFRLDAALSTRFDGEVIGAARISARAATLYPVGMSTADCYAARVTPGPMRVGRRYTVRLFLSAGDQAPLELVVPLERARRGDAKGARLGC